MTSASVRIGGREVGAGHPVYIVAELSANHGGRLDRALELVAAVADAGVDAVKIQTYRPESLTIDSDAPPFRVGAGSLWEGRRLWDLYAEAQTPWEWHDAIFAAARDAGIACFSTPFDDAAIELLEGFDPPAYKVASFELVDLALVAAIARRGRPVVMSTGMASVDEIDDAVRTARDAGAGGIVLLRCNSGYPAQPGEMDLRTIPDMIERWDVPVGLSDHTLGMTAAIASVGLGAVMLEKHVTTARADGGPDAAFSLEPAELRALVASVREAEAALGDVRYGPSPSEHASEPFRRSLYAVRDIAASETIAADAVRSIRPAGGLAPKELPAVIGRRARVAIARGTPISWDLLD
ncbi:MAG TPA: pseudaminic acid synthase [Acidimicrobiia bacterium]|nr:pseudaminic acid synthase [Acidimicrobiia bacterium]